MTSGRSPAHDPSARAVYEEKNAGYEALDKIGQLKDSWVPTFCSKLAWTKLKETEKRRNELRQFIEKDD
jgi:hypothetical protein